MSTEVLRGHSHPGLPLHLISVYWFRKLWIGLNRTAPRLNEINITEFSLIGRIHRPSTIDINRRQNQFAWAATTVFFLALFENKNVVGKCSNDKHEMYRWGYTFGKWWNGVLIRCSIAEIDETGERSVGIVSRSLVARLRAGAVYARNRGCNWGAATERKLLKPGISNSDISTSLRPLYKQRLRCNYGRLRWRITKSTSRSASLRRLKYSCHQLNSRWQIIYTVKVNLVIVCGGCSRAVFLVDDNNRLTVCYWLLIYAILT